MNRPVTVTAAGRIAPALAAVLLLLTVSAVWIETDIYRISALLLFGWASYLYVWGGERPSVGWMGLACFAWVAFVGLRYLAAYLSESTQSFGTSEGIYLLPYFYPAVGYMMFRYPKAWWPVTIAFMGISLAIAAATVDVRVALEGGFDDFLLMNNQIHSSAAGGLIILAAINFAAYVSRTVSRLWPRVLLEAAAYSTVVLCFIGIYAAKSKGVWIAIVIAFAIQILLSAGRAAALRTLVSGTVLLAALAFFFWSEASAIWATMGPSMDSVSGVVWRGLQTGHPLVAIREAIASGTVPLSTNLRLMLWYDAVEVWLRNPVLGSGIAWRDAFVQATYKDVGFSIVHNGYLEVAMRYGLVGLGFYATLYGWSILIAYRALRRRLIPREAFGLHVVSLVFFAVTIMSNSNNRLAIGESLMLVAAAFGFCCLYLCQVEKAQLAGAPSTA